MTSTRIFRTGPPLFMRTTDLLYYKQFNISYEFPANYLEILFLSVIAGCSREMIEAVEIFLSNV